MIEYNGRQHYEQSEFFGSLEAIIERDKNKANWCIENKMPLLVVPYTLTDNEIYQKLQNFLEQITDVDEWGQITIHARGEE